MSPHTALFVVGSVSLLVAIVIAALWALAKRMQIWKEHIVTVMSVMEANNAHAHDVTRTMIWKNKEALSAELAALRKDVSALREERESPEPEESQVATNPHFSRPL
jgi:hypothetical protein